MHCWPRQLKGNQLRVLPSRAWREKSPRRLGSGAPAVRRRADVLQGDATAGSAAGSTPERVRSTVALQDPLLPPRTEQG